VISLFELDGGGVDRGYANLREARFTAEAEMRETLEAMWSIYEPYADPDFRSGFAHDPDGRFWEMYLGWALLQAGKALLPAKGRARSGGQPDICVVEAERRIWIEAIAPDRGKGGPDQVRGPRPVNQGGGFEPVPVRQAQLRATSALWTKSQIVKDYLQTGVIRPDDVRLIAIGGGRFGIHVPEGRLPLIMSSVFPIGDEFVTIDRQQGSVTGRGFEDSLAIERHGGAIPRTAFVCQEFAHISGIIWSRIGLGNMSRTDRPLTFVHNPFAVVPMKQSWGIWDREFVTRQKDDGWESEDILAVAQC
jgi:hypothetical protein